MGGVLACRNRLLISRAVTDAPTSESRIAQLDGWRGVSILLVIAGHLAGLRYGVAEAPLSLANLGVCIFFVISGFIITRLALAEIERTGTFSARLFFTRRALRILPPFYFYLAAALLLGASGFIAIDASSALHAAAFTCNITKCDWFTGHSWSLAFEEQFYLAFPVIVLLFMPRLRSALIAIFAALTLFPFAKYLIAKDSFRLATDMAFYFSMIAAGAVAAAHEPTIRRLSASRTAVSLNIAAALFVGLVAALDMMQVAPGSVPSIALRAVKTLGLPLALMWLVTSAAHQQAAWTRVLASAPLTWIGTISYSLYLWQQLFSAEPWRYQQHAWLFAAPLMLVFAAASYYGSERPFMRLAKRFRSERAIPARHAATHGTL